MKTKMLFCLSQKSFRLLRNTYFQRVTGNLQMKIKATQKWIGKLNKWREVSITDT